MNNETEILVPPAAGDLRDWLELKGLSLHAWALQNGLDPAALSKIMSGKQGASLARAVQIEELTEGAVKASRWRRR
jgi:hypothetical protein